MIVLHRSVMLPRGIDILMAKYISHEVNIARILIEHRTVGAAQLVRRDLFDAEHSALSAHRQCADGDSANAGTNPDGADRG